MRSVLRSSDYIRQRPPSRGAWIGAGLTTALAAASLFRLPEASVLLLVALWILWARRRPDLAFGSLLAFFVLFYYRTPLGQVVVAEGSDRGGVSVGDVLWVGYLGVLVWARFGVWRGFQRLLTRHPVAGVFPYVFLSVVLPVVGILIGDWPLSYVTPAARHLQWAGFALMAFVLSRRYGPQHVWGIVSHVLALACILHALYAALQLGYSIGMVPRSWLYLDDLYRESRVRSWFYYPRTTGLLQNPNNYGITSATAAVVAIAQWQQRSRPLWLWRLMVLTALFGVFTSGSRAGLLGLLLGLFLIICRPGWLGARSLIPSLRLGAILLALGVIAWASCSYLPPTLQGRYARLSAFTSEGAEADANFAGRRNAWNERLAEYREHYPLGTWVAPSYALDSVDSYYVQIWVQGTPIYMLCFIVLLLVSWRNGSRLMQDGETAGGSAGLSLMGITGAVAIASIACSPLLAPHVNAVFWSIFGLVSTWQRTPALRHQWATTRLEVV